MIRRSVAVFVVVSAASLAVGCATTTTSRSAVLEKNKEKLSIYATGKTGGFATDITLFVNDQVVAQGSTTLVKPAVNLSGMYKDIKIDAECKSVATGPMLHRECVVYANSDKVAELSF